MPDISKTIKVFENLFQNVERPVALHEPVIAGNEWKYIKDCLNTNWVSSVGAYVEKFEEELARFTGAKRTIVTVNGTAALHLCLSLVGVKHGDEVIIPSLTFVATANAVAYCGATPLLAESDEATLGMDPVKLNGFLADVADIRDEGTFNRKTGRRIGCVVVMHTFGHPVDLDKFVEVCRKYRLELVEDAAESLGSYYKNRHTGLWGKVASLSFNGNKIITSGGGGAILTNDPVIADRAKHISTTAKLSHPWKYIHDQLGYNYRMPNINAALGLAQLERLPEFLELKRKLVSRYQQGFDGVDGISIFLEPQYAKSNYWLNCLLLDEADEDMRDELLRRTNDMQIQTRPTWELMHELPMYHHCPRMDLTVAERLKARLINIPSGASL